MSKVLFLPGIRSANFNLLKNSDFNRWAAGASSAPSDWTLTAAGATIAREGTTKTMSLYSCKITKAAGADTELYQDIHSNFGIDYFKNKVVTFTADIRAGEANKVVLVIDDGVGTTLSVAHTGAAAFQRLSVSRVISSTATQVRLMIRITLPAASMDTYIDACDACEYGLTPYNLVDPFGFTMKKSASGSNQDSHGIEFWHDTGGSDKKKVLKSDGTNDSLKALANDGSTKIFEFYDSGILSFPNNSAASVYLNSAQNLPSNTWTKVLLDTEVYDLRGEFASNKFTVTKAGYYLCVASLAFVSNDAGVNLAAGFYKNGSLARQSYFSNGSAGGGGCNISEIFSLVASDYIEFWAYQSSAAAKALYTGSDKTWMSIIKVA